MSEVFRPATFYEWLMLIKHHKLRLGPLEGYRDSLVHHALGRTNGQSFGFWDHQANSGFLDMERGAAPRAREIKPAPPVSDADPDWKE